MRASESPSRPKQAERSSERAPETTSMSLAPTAVSAASGWSASLRCRLRRHEPQSSGPLRRAPVPPILDPVTGAGAGGAEDVVVAAFVLARRSADTHCG